MLDSAGAGAADRPLLTTAQIAAARRQPLRAAQTIAGFGRGRLLAVPADHGRVVVVGQSLTAVDRARSQLTVLLVLGGLGALAVSGLGAWWLTGRALAPLDRLTAAAAAIGADDLRERVKVPPTGDEAARLARTLNGLLRRVSRAVEDQRAFLADASHELRSPVAVLLAELEVALRAPETPPAARTTLESLREEADHLSRLIDDLLALARSDAGHDKLRREAIGLEVAAERALRLLAGAAARRGVVLKQTLTRAPVWGDPDRLTQVAVNLLENAIRHTPAGAWAGIETGVRGSLAFLAVHDAGPGIPPALAPAVFERFSRGDAARGRAGGGTGLGLAIARTIARAHGGDLRLDRTGADGTTFVLEVPARPIDDAHSG